MKYSNTAITQLTRWYKQILIKCAIFNAAILTGGVMIAASANATEYTTQQVLTKDTTYTASDSFVGSTSPAGNYGGAIYNDGHNLTINGSSFTGNYLNTGTASDARGGAIYQSGGKLDIDGASFIDNYTVRDAGGRAGAIQSGSATTTISNSLFQNNSTRTSTGEDWVYGGMGAAIYQGGGTLTLNNNTFGGDTADKGNKGAEGIIVSNGGEMVVNGNTFQNNSASGGIFNLQNSTTDVTFVGENTFENNAGSPIYNWIIKDTTTFANDSETVFESNTANTKDNNGGAIWNLQKIAFEDGSTVEFTNNHADGKGGAVYNEGTIDFNGAATFSGNTDENGANDIYNIGTVNFGNADDISFEGGIDGVAGVVNVNGTGEVLVKNALKNQTVNVASELHLDGANVSGSTINLGSDAVLNTINNKIENYSAIELADGSNIRVDANLDLGQMDKFSATYGHDEVDLNIVEANFIGTATSADGVQLVNNGVKVNTSSMIYEWDDATKTRTKTGIVGSGNADGKVNISNGASSSFLEDAAEDTQAGVKESVIYEMGEDENFGTATVENATFVVEGNNQSVNVSGTFGVDNQSVVTMNNVVFDGTGSIDTYGKLRINNSEVNVDLTVRDYAEFESDPTTFSGTVNVESLGTASFDDDTFTSTATLNNQGTANFINTTFENGSEITNTGTGTGVLNFNGGTNILGASVEKNSLSLNNGSSLTLTDDGDIDGLALTTDANGGTLDLRNKKIDTLGSTVLGSDLDVLMDLDLNADKSDTLGTISGGYGLNLQALELLALGGDTENIQIATAGTNVALSSSVMDTLHTYYKNVSYDSLTGILTLDTKASPVTDLIGTWGTGNYIKAYNSADAANTSVGANLGYLDTQVKVNADDITDIQDDMLVGFGGNYIAAGTDVAANLEALDAQAKVNADAIAGKTLTVDTSTGVATIKDGTTTAEVYTKDAAETIFAEKQAWTSKELGYDTASTDAKTILTAAGFTNQTTGDTDVGLIDAALQLKTEKQNALTAGSGIDITSDVISVKDASLANFDATKVTDSTEIAAVLADPTTASDANVLTEKAVVDGVSALFNQKQAWASKELGYDTASTDAKTILTAAGFTNQTTGDSDVGLIDATLQLKADKQDKLVIAADSGLKWNDANQTQLSVRVNEDKGLKVTSNGIEINAGDTMQFSTSGKLDIKYDTNTFTATTTDGLKIASKGIKAGMIDDGAVSFANLATDAVATSITGATNKVATDKAVKDYAEKVVSDAITFNTDNTVTLTVGSNSANVYDTTGTANYVKANAQNADYIALTSGAVDLTSNSTIAQALQTLDSSKASLAKDNTFTGANTFKSDSGIVIQNATTPSVQANLVAKQLTIGTDTHDILELTVSDTSGKGSALYVKDADIVTNSGFMALDVSGTDRFSADEKGIETKDASGNTTFSVASATGNTTVAGTMDIEGNTTIGDYFSVTASDGSFSAANGAFAVDGSGNLTTSGLSHLDGGVNVNDKLVIGTDGSLATDGTLSANGKALLQGGINVNNKFVVATDGTTGIDAGLTVTGATLLNNTLDVNGRTTLSDTNGLQFGTGPNVKAIDDGTTAQTSAGTNNATTLATVATVLKSAENGAYTGTATKKADGSAVATIKEGIDLIGDLSSTGISATTLAGQIGSISAVETRSGTGMQMAATNTVSANLQALDKAIGSEITGVDRSASLAGATTLATASVNDNIKALDIALGNLTYTGGSVNYTNGTGSVTSAIKTINANIGAALTSVASRGAAYTLVATDSVNQNLAKLDAAIGADVTAADGNIATGTTVNANLDSLDTAIGNRATLASKNADINAKTATSVAKGLEAAGNAIGDAQFGATHYASSATDASTAIRSLDENLFRLEDEVIDLRKDVRRGFASMAAMSAMVPNARSTGNTQLSVGTGMYSGHTGFALGGFHWFTDNLMMNVGVAYGDGDSSDMIYRAGITYSW